MDCCIKHRLVILMLTSGLISSNLLAAEHEHEHYRGHEAGGRVGWHGEIGRFHEHDIDLWRGGHWSHARHDGRYGWWWIVGGVWYFYPARIDPYPDPYQPPIMVVPASPAPPQYWYYCANPVGYYPYVAQCNVNWQRVPATASPAAPIP